MKKILILEDEPELAEMFSLALQKAGFEVIVQNDGAEALKRVKAFKPCLVLLDLVMPNVNGYEVLKEVKEYVNGSGIKVYAWSNLTQKQEISQAKRMGADGYLIKSDFTPSRLVEKVKEILK